MPQGGQPGPILDSNHVGVLGEISAYFRQRLDAEMYALEAIRAGDEVAREVQDEIFFERFGGFAGSTGGLRAVAQSLSHGHHPLAKFLGGLKTGQRITQLPAPVHTQFHSLLRQGLEKAGIPLKIGGRGGAAADWARYMNANPGAQRQAFDATLDAARAIDAQHGTSLVRDVWYNIMQGKFTPYP